MTKGCFIKGIFILTIVVGVLVYLIQTKSNEWIIKPGKSLLTKVSRTAVDKNLVIIKDSPEKDSLKAILGDFFNQKMFTMNSFSDKMFDPLVDSLKKFSKDSIISIKELNNIKLVLKKIEDEGSKED